MVPPLDNPLRYRAEVTGQWVVRDSVASQECRFDYDFFEVLARLGMIWCSELDWGVYFRQQRIAPYRLVYEDFFADLERQLQDLIAVLGGLPPRPHCI